MLLTSSGDRARALGGRSVAEGRSRSTGADGPCSACMATIPGARLALGTRRGNPEGVTGPGGGLAAGGAGWSSARRCRSPTGGGAGEGAGGRVRGASATLGGGGGRRLCPGVPVPPGRLRRHGVLLGPVAPKRQMVSLKVRVIEPVGTGGLEDRQVLLAQLTIPRLPRGGRRHRRGD